jgi:hypothetical protein
MVPQKQTESGLSSNTLTIPELEQSMEEFTWVDINALTYGQKSYQEPKLD